MALDLHENFYERRAGPERPPPSAGGWTPLPEIQDRRAVERRSPREDLGQEASEREPALLQTPIRSRPRPPGTVTSPSLSSRNARSSGWNPPPSSCCTRSR